MEVWLDDERDPNDPFIQREYHARPGMVWVKSPEEAIELLQTGQVTHISLDHDLCLPDPRNGYQVACWIEEQAYHKTLKPLTWRIHTDNSSAFRKMFWALTNAKKFWREHGPLS